MVITDISPSISPYTDLIRTIATDCSDYLKSGDFTFFKEGRPEWSEINRTKVRHNGRKYPTLSEAFKTALHSDVSVLNRSVIVSAHPKSDDDFIIIPPNGYRVISSAASVMELRSSFDTITESVQHPTTLLSELVQLSYTSEHISEPIQESLLYNIPYYYAIRRNALSLTLLQTYATINSNI